MHVKFELPAFTAQEAERLAREVYEISGIASKLPSERDQNFHLQAPHGRYVLKIANISEDRQVLEFQNNAIEHLTGRAQELRIPALIRTKQGEGIAEVAGDSGQTHFLRVLTFIPARLFANVRPHSAALLRSLGHALGIMDRALQDFSHPAAHRRLKWDLAHAGWIRDYLYTLREPEQRTIVDGFLQIFEDEVISPLPGLRKSVIYNDANDYNILVGSHSNVLGFIDFGDMLYSHTVCNLAVALAYAMLHQPDPINAAAHVLHGYHRVFRLTGEELRILFPLACMRLCITVVNAAYQREVEPGNAYLTISEQPAWETLYMLSKIANRDAYLCLSKRVEAVKNTAR